MRLDVQAVLDNRRKFFHRVMLQYNSILKIMPEELAARMVGPIAGDSKEQMPIQAADLLAYETAKEAINRPNNAKPVRIALRRLVEAGKHYAGCYHYRITGAEFDRVRKDTGKRPAPEYGVLFESGKDVRAPGNLWCA
jgi:hypothetical protein